MAAPSLVSAFQCSVCSALNGQPWRCNFCGQMTPTTLIQVSESLAFPSPRNAADSASSSLSTTFSNTQLRDATAPILIQVSESSAVPSTRIVADSASSSLITSSAATAQEFLQLTWMYGRPIVCARFCSTETFLAPSLSSIFAISKQLLYNWHCDFYDVTKASCAWPRIEREEFTQADQEIRFQDSPAYMGYWIRNEDLNTTCGVLGFAANAKTLLSALALATALAIEIFHHPIPESTITDTSFAECLQLIQEQRGEILDSS